MGARIRQVVTETLLWAAAALGLVAIILVISAYAFNTSVILFRTGSMEPTVPAGSAALIQEVPATEVGVGDILTVARPGHMPITHRVTSVESGDAPEERVITMQGDANESPDPYPYTITEGRVMLGSVPGVANLIHQMGSPYVLGGVTLAASVLVGWAFWPRRRAPSPPTAAPRAEQARPKSHPDPTARPRHASTGVAVLAVTAAALSQSTAPAQATTAPKTPETGLVEETKTSEHITVTSIYDPATRMNLTPETISEWDIGITADAPSSGEARAGLSGYGDFPLEVTVLSCSQQWSDLPSGGHPEMGRCSGASHTVAEEMTLNTDTEVHWLDAFTTEDTPWLRLLVGVPHEEGPAPEGVAGLTVHVEAWDDELRVDSEISPDEPTAPEQERDQYDDGAIPTDLPADDNGLARTGISVALLLAAALGSVFVGRYLQSRSTDSSSLDRRTH